MNERGTYGVLEEIFRDIFDDDSIVLSPTTSAKDIPEWDSFTHINIIAVVEQKLGIKFTTTEVEGLKNVGDFVALIERKKK